ncbi:primase-helicase family protein [Burkholderia cepacia]|uniref:primase-helicase family protein n=1 Tax=Burkholderia cepacia TaxID=292 RepID=UPI00158A12F8|nr:primase-helicase family protein [Burkholderia cepacia]
MSVNEELLEVNDVDDYFPFDEQDIAEAKGNNGALSESKPNAVAKKEKQESDRAKKALDLDSEEIRFISDISLFQEKYSIVNRNGTTMICFQDKKLGLQFQEIGGFHNFNQQYHYNLEDKNTGKVREVYLTRSFMKSPYTKRYFGIIFDPTNNAWDNKNYLNLWKGWTVKALNRKVNISEIQPYIDLTNAMTNDDQQGTEYLLNYWAHAIQKPEQLPKTCIVLKGKQGTGKNVHTDTHGSMCSENYVQVTSSNLLTGNFNGHQQSAFILFADEAVWGGNSETEGILKAMIASPTTIINDKNRTAFETRNFKRIIVASNEDYPVPVSDGDRRYVVFEVSDRYKGQTAEGQFFDKYNKWLNNGGRELIFTFLKQRDISKFNVETEQPKTQAWAELMITHLNNEYRFIYELLSESAQLSKDTEKRDSKNVLKWNRQGLFKNFIEWCKLGNKKYIPTSDAFGKAMSKVFNFDKDDKNWKANWKDKDGYFYKMPEKHESQRRMAEDYLKVNPKHIFFDFKI